MKVHYKRFWPALAAAGVAAISELQKTQGHDPRWAAGLAMALVFIQSLMPPAVVRKGRPKGDKGEK